MVGWMKARSSLKALRKDRRGVAAIEFALVGGLLIIGILNAADTGVYVYLRMEVENAAQVGTMNALKTCDPTKLPATVNCPALNAAVTASIQSTSLGAAVALNPSITEGYYCLTPGGVLQYVSDVNSRPNDCSSVGSPSLQPVDYLQVPVTYTYAPMFPGISIGGAFTTPITKTALVRMQ